MIPPEEIAEIKALLALVDKGKWGWRQPQGLGSTSLMLTDTPDRKWFCAILMGMNCSFAEQTFFARSRELVERLLADREKILAERDAALLRIAAAQKGDDEAPRQGRAYHGRCDNCGACVPTEGGREVTHDCGEPRHGCKMCGKAYYREADYYAHMEIAHDK